MSTYPDPLAERSSALDAPPPAPNAPPPTRHGYDAIPLYAPGTAPCAVDVSDTVNLWGAPPAALDALRAAAATATVAHYPALYNAELREPLAAYAGVRAEHVVTGCGSDDVLDCAIRAFGEPGGGGTLAHASPTFSMVPVYARANGLTPVGVPLTGDDYAVDADALLATGASIIYLCSPNNPTATPVARDAVLRVVERARGLVILDEAYAEFVLADGRARAEVFTPEAPGWGRVLVLRTLSKAFGLAGLRVGYGVGHAAVVREVEKARGPFKVTYPAEKAALAALADSPGGLAWVRARAAAAVAQRERLLAGLRALGLVPAPSVANFVFAPVAGAAEVARRLRARGVGARVFGGLPLVVPALRAAGGTGLRLAVGPDAVQNALLGALAEVLAELRAETGADATAGAVPGGPPRDQDGAESAAPHTHSSAEWRIWTQATQVGGEP
jgi:histidinol-phosphate aminotransferase